MSDALATVVFVDKSEIRDFLVSRRERLTPQQAGLPAWGGNRRVKGLRREEVAMLAGIGVDYYTRLERGNLGGASDQVLDALANALRLDDAERAHLFDLSRASQSAGGRPRRPVARVVRPQVHWLLDRMDSTPAYVRDFRGELLAANALGRALYAPVFEAERANIYWFCFLDPAAPDFFVEWEKLAADAAATLRMAVGEYPRDRALMALVGELTSRSRAFATAWASHDVRQHRTGAKRLRHPVIGDVTLSYESMQLTADPGLVLNAYTAEPGSPQAEALALLASWVMSPSAAR